MMRKFFGTDGIRGKIGEQGSYITPKMMTKLGWAAGKIIQAQEAQNKAQSKNPKFKSSVSVMVGKDTRISGYMLESALEAGFIAAGVNVYLTGPMPTPAIAYLTKTFSCDVGIAITASHNPYTDNGIKFFSSNGEKLSDELEVEIEKLLSEPMDICPAHLLGKAFRINDSAGRYIEFCKSSFPMNLNLEGIKMVVDCANGATYHIAPDVFKELGAEVITIHDEPDGLNINDQCGSNSTESLADTVKRHQADLGIAFDGDGDRICLIDHRGRIINGDSILYLLAKYLKAKNKLSTPEIVGTEMTNLGLEIALNRMNLQLHRTKVGDRFIRQRMKESGSNLGGESSGHILYTDFTNTGDAIIASLQVLRAMLETDSSLEKMLEGLELYPSLMENITIPNGLSKTIPALLLSEEFKSLTTPFKAALGENGRILIRPSGTEPVIRVMVEGLNRGKCEVTLAELTKAIKVLLVKQEI